MDELTINELYRIEMLLRLELRDRPTDATASLADKVRTIRLTRAKAWLNS